MEVVISLAIAGTFSSFLAYLKQRDVNQLKTAVDIDTEGTNSGIKYGFLATQLHIPAHLLFKGKSYLNLTRKVHSLREVCFSDTSGVGIFEEEGTPVIKSSQATVYSRSGLNLSNLIPLIILRQENQLVETTFVPCEKFLSLASLNFHTDRNSKIRGVSSTRYLGEKTYVYGTPTDDSSYLIVGKFNGKTFVTESTDVYKDISREELIDNWTLHRNLWSGVSIALFTGAFGTWIGDRYQRGRK